MATTMAEGEEGIFQINDYTQYTEFESLTNDIELFIRQSGYSVEIRQGSLTDDLRASMSGSQKREFVYRTSDFACEKRGAKSQETDSLEPICLREMWDDSPTFFPFRGPNFRPSNWFGIGESLVITGDELDKGEEKVVLSAFAVATHAAKCALPVFRISEGAEGTREKAAQGLLLYPGLQVMFDVWNFGAKAWRLDGSLSFLADYRSLVEYFQREIDPLNNGVTACGYADYVRPKRDSQWFDAIKEVHVYGHWSVRTSPEFASCLHNGSLNPRACDSFRVKLTYDTASEPASKFIALVAQPAQDGEICISSLKESVRESVYFDEFLRMLTSLFPVFPINSFWTKVGIDYLFEAGNFSAKAIKSIAERIGRVAESGIVAISTQSDFKFFDSYAEIHQHALTALAAHQCRALLLSRSAVDVDSRSVFLHQKAKYTKEAQLMQPEALKAYNEKMLLRILRAYYVDKFAIDGRIPSSAMLVAWHKDSQRSFPYYSLITEGVKEEELVAQWEQVTARTAGQTAAYVLEELSKEMEIAVETLKATSEEEIETIVPGLCVTSVISLVFRRQIALLAEMRPSHLAIPIIQDLIRPSFREFRRFCRHLPNFRHMDSVVINEVSISLMRLETAINHAFSLSIHFPDSRGLIQKLMKTDEVDATEGSDRESALAFVSSLKGKHLWETQIVLRTEKTRLSCTIGQAETTLAVARVERERPLTE